MIKHLHRVLAARNTRASVTLGELAVGIPRLRIVQFSRSFLPAAAERL